MKARDLVNILVIYYTMYSTWGPGMGHRKAEEAHKECGNVAVQVLTKCGRVLGVQSTPL